MMPEVQPGQTLTASGSAKTKQDPDSPSSTAVSRENQ